jgi:hypothetical protein
MRMLGSRSFAGRVSTIGFIIVFIFSQVHGQAAVPQDPAGLRLNVVEGQGVVHDVRQRIEKPVIVDVTDDSNRPVTGAVIGFLLLSSGPGGAFDNARTAFTAVTDAMGRAVARFTPNDQVGTFQMIITASYQGQSATVTISQSNVSDEPQPGPGPRTVPRTGGAGGGGGMSGSTIALLVAAAAGAVALGVVVSQSGGDSSPQSPTPDNPTGQPTIRIGVGSGPSVGAPNVWQSSVRPSRPIPKWRP